MLTSCTRAGVAQRHPVPPQHCKAQRPVAVKAYRQPAGSVNNLSCPYEVLGLDPSTADEAQIKSQYRKLAKQYHPDVSKDQSDSTPQFLNITQAYEFLLCQLRNKDRLDANGNVKPGNSDAFHDWYWSFRMSRGWGRQQQAKATEDDAGASTAQASTPQSVEGLRSQLAGLRHRAAIRKQKAATNAATEPEPEQPQPEKQGSPQSAAQGNPGSYAAADGPSDSADPPAAPLPTDMQQPQAQQKKFINNSNVQEGLKQQLYGMRRKAALKREFGM